MNYDLIIIKYIFVSRKVEFNSEQYNHRNIVIYFCKYIIVWIKLHNRKSARDASKVYLVESQIVRQNVYQYYKVTVLILSMFY